ncbi:hypothetical protein Goarm_017683 [Gossypium armourianum]|uniref:Uncharacterized protein n=1 Tax=Gossypium armourianum TaxID=34283 RepID=A0A7J9JGV8_9ROSI|nr:hypothetical protein [Gossypium armourianum]
MQLVSTPLGVVIKDYYRERIHLSLDTTIMVTPFSPFSTRSCGRQICHQKLRLQYGGCLITTFQRIVISITEGFEVQQSVLDAQMELKR